MSGECNCKCKAETRESPLKAYFRLQAEHTLHIERAGRLNRVLDKFGVPEVPLYRHDNGLYAYGREIYPLKTNAGNQKLFLTIGGKVVLMDSIIYSNFPVDGTRAHSGNLDANQPDEQCLGTKTGGALVEETIAWYRRQFQEIEPEVV